VAIPIACTNHIFQPLPEPTFSPLFSERVINAWNAIPANVDDFGSVKKFGVFSSNLILVVLPNVLNFLLWFNMLLLCLYDLLGFISERDTYVHVRYRLSAVRLSVVCLSVTLVHPTQPVEIFRNCFTVR